MNSQSIFDLLSCHFILFYSYCFVLCFDGAVQHVGFYFPTRDQTCTPLQWNHGVLTTGPPGKSISLFYIKETCKC